jgi:hypothetical protein
VKTQRLQILDSATFREYMCGKVSFWKLQAIYFHLLSELLYLGFRSIPSERAEISLDIVTYSLVLHISLATQGEFNRLLLVWIVGGAWF